MENKINYKVDLYFKYPNKNTKETLYLTEKPNINDYQDYFAPKLSNCYSIQFFFINFTGRYILMESWSKSKKKGWQKIL